MGWFVVLAGLVVLGLWRYLRVSSREAGARMLAEYEQAFPGRCGICAYDRYGVREGYIRPDDRVSHFCREKGRWIE